MMKLSWLGSFQLNLLGSFLIKCLSDVILIMFLTRNQQFLIYKYFQVFKTKNYIKLTGSRKVPPGS